MTVAWFNKYHTAHDIVCSLNLDKIIITRFWQREEWRLPNPAGRQISWVKTTRCFQGRFQEAKKTLKASPGRWHTVREDQPSLGENTMKTTTTSSLSCWISNVLCHLQPPHNCVGYGWKAFLPPATTWKTSVFKVRWVCAERSPGEAQMCICISQAGSMCKYWGLMLCFTVVFQLYSCLVKLCGRFLVLA